MEERVFKIEQIKKNMKQEENIIAGYNLLTVLTTSTAGILCMAGLASLISTDGARGIIATSIGTVLTGVDLGLFLGIKEAHERYNDLSEELNNFRGM